MSKQIGWSNESSLLHEILKKISKLTVVTSGSGTVNLNQVAGVSTAAGAGATTLGTQRVTLASDDPAVERLKEIAGQDFLYISDTNAHATLDCTSIYVVADAVFSNITVGGSDVVAAKGLSAQTVPAGTLLPFGKVHATSITLTSGTVIAYIK